MAQWYGQFDYFEKNGGSNVLEQTNRIFRDVGAWYHFLLLGIQHNQQLLTE